MALGGRLVESGSCRPKGALIVTILCGGELTTLLSPRGTRQGASEFHLGCQPGCGRTLDGRLFG